LEDAGPMPDKGVGIGRLFSCVYEASRCTLGGQSPSNPVNFSGPQATKIIGQAASCLLVPQWVTRLPHSLHRGNEVSRQINDRYDQTDNQCPHRTRPPLQQFALSTRYAKFTLLD
jgi:hypothetical protein